MIPRSLDLGDLITASATRQPACSVKPFNSPKERLAVSFPVLFRQGGPGCSSYTQPTLEALGKAALRRWM